MLQVMASEGRGVRAVARQAWGVGAATSGRHRVPLPAVGALMLLYPQWVGQ